MACCSCGGAWRGTRPRPGLSANPSTPCARKRCAHLYTKRRLIPTMAAMAVIDTPSATSKIIRPRLARPAEMVVARCHASSVRRSAGVRWMVREVLRPRAIPRPCVIPVETITTWGPGVIRGTCLVRQTATTSPLVARHDVSEKTMCGAGCACTPCEGCPCTGQHHRPVLPVSRPWSPWETESVVAHRQCPAPNAWNPSPQVRPHRAPATCGQSLPACPRPPPSPSLRRQTVPGLRSMGADAVRSVNHTVRLDICVSAQHGFVGQAWSGRVVGLRPTRRPLRLSRHAPANG